MIKNIAVIGSQTLGTPTEINEVLHGKNQVIIVKNESKTESFRIENVYNDSEYFIKPLTRKERRKLMRKRK